MMIIIIITYGRIQRCTNRIIKNFVIFRLFQIQFLGNNTDCYTIKSFFCRNSICLHFHTQTYITKLYDKCDDCTFPIVNFPFISSNIPASPAYGVYISQLVSYSRACAQYSDFLDRAQLLMQNLLKHG